MRMAVIRTAARACALLVACLAAAPAAAQEAREATVTPPAERLVTTPTQVDMRSGQYAYSQTDLSIGEDNETGGIALTRSMNAGVPGHINPFANFSHNWDIMLWEKHIDIDEGNYTNGPDYRMHVAFGGRSESFQAKAEDSGYQQVSNNWRAQLTFTSGTLGSATAIHTYTAADGTVAVFRPLGSGSNGDCSSVFRCAYVSQITHPDGTRFDFEYDAGTGPTRLRAVVSNRGYALLLQYGSGSDANHVTSSCVINLAVVARPANNTCPGSPQATTSYTYTTFESKRRLATAVDANEATSSFTHARISGTLRMGFLRPGDASAWMTNTLTEWTDNEGVPKELVDAQAFVDGTSWTYFWTFAPQVEGEIAQVAGGNFTDPAGGATQVNWGFERQPAPFGPQPVNFGDIVWQITPGPASIVDPLGRTTTSNYCDRAVELALPDPHDCLVTMAQSFTEPDGRVTELTYDGQATRNVTQVRRKAVPGSGLADIVTYAAYSCTNNIVCNRATSRTDAMGNVTDYVWDTTHGGLISETGPAPTTGAPRPQTRHTYAPRTAWILNPAGGGYVAAAPIQVRTSTSLCRTSAATGNPASPCTAGALDEVKTLYDYGPDSGPNTLLLRGQAVTAEYQGALTVYRTCYTYDARGRRTGETQPNANLSSCPATQTSAQPYTSNQRHDAMGRVTGTISADPDAVGSGNPFLAVRNTYDGAGRLIKVETGRLSAWQSDSVVPLSWTGFTVDRTVETLYDAMGRKTRDTLRTGEAGTIQTVTQYSYDNMSRLTCTAVRMNAAIFASLPASACTLGTEGTLGPDRITRNVYDAAGQRLQLREGVGVTGVEAAEATWAYNLNGQVTTVIDGNGNRAALGYDGHARQISWTFPSTTRPTSFNDATQATALATAGSVNAGDYEQYGYDSNGNRISLRKRDNTTLTYQYDALNRMIVKVVPERPAPHPYPLTPAQTRDVFYSYDLRNLQLSARFDSPSGEGVTNTYDGFGRLASTISTMGGTMRTLGYQHDANGARTRITHPDGNQFGTDYDGLGRPTHIRANIYTVMAGQAYRNHGGLAGRSLANSATSQWGYDGVQRLSAMIQFLAGTAHDAIWGYAYNPASQIRLVTRDNDIYAWTGHYAVTRAYTTDGLNRYSAAGGATFGYDANGNLTSDGARTYTYDVENRLVTASPNVALAYDPLGRLFSLTSGATTTQFLYDGDALVAEYVSGAMTRRYVHNVGADVPLLSYAGAGLTQPSYLHADHQGSIVAVSNASGAGTINTYDEYGIPAAANTGRFQYTGQVWLPELGMYHYKARIYSPTLGRFMQTDPVGYADQFNLYAYVGNDPLNMRDPDGRTCVGGAKGYDCDVNEPGELNPEELAAQNAAYTESVNRLMRNPEGEVTVTVGGVEMQVTQREIANGLIRADVVASSDPVGQGAHTLGGGLTPGQGTEDGRPRIVLFPHGQQMPGLREDFQQQERVFRFIHEGIHTVPQESVFRDVPNFNGVHQPEYRRVVRDIYGQ